MKRAISVLLLLALCAVPALAEESSDLKGLAGDFLSSLGETADAFVNLAGEAGKVAVHWAEGVIGDAQDFLNARLPEAMQWLEDVESALSEASGSISEEASEALSTLKESLSDAGAHTRQEIDNALAVLRESLAEAGFDVNGPEDTDEAAGAVAPEGEAPDPLDDPTVGE